MTRPHLSRGPRPLRASLPTALAVTLALAGPAAAEPAPELPRLAPNAQLGTFTLLRDGAPMVKGTFGLQLTGTWTRAPQASPDTLDGGPTHAWGLHAGIGWAPERWLELGAALPVAQVDDPVGAPALTGPLQALGDLTLTVGLAPLRQRDGAPLSLSLVPRVVVPLGVDPDLSVAGLSLGGLSDGGLAVGGDVALARRAGVMHLGAAVGYTARLRPVDVPTWLAGDVLRAGVGVGAQLAGGAVGLDLEWSGATVVPRGEDPGPLRAWMEVLGGLRLRPVGSPLGLKVAAGPGMGLGWGTPDVRVIAQVDLGHLHPRTRPKPAPAEVVAHTPGPDDEEALAAVDVWRFEPLALEDDAPSSLDFEVLFGSTGSELDPAATWVLAVVRDALLDGSGRLEVRGHGEDGPGGAIDRAAAVVGWLASHGVPADRLVLRADPPAGGAPRVALTWRGADEGEVRDGDGWVLAP